MTARLSKYILTFIFICISSFSYAQEFEEPDPATEFEEQFDIQIVDPELYTHVSAPDSIHRGDSPFRALRNKNFSDTTRVWWKLALRNQLDLKDTTIQYPAFVKFCIDVYNWADKAFNYYDPNYVVGTGRRWKARLVFDSWVDSYAMSFNYKMPVRMMSNLYNNAGAYIQYMAVSVGYTTNVSQLMGQSPGNHKKMEFGFTCARFSAEVYLQENKEGTYIRRFGDAHNGKFFKEKFSGLTLNKKGLMACYFFNNKKYSQGAAYNFSKFQIRSQGSPIVGFIYNNLDININFTELNDNLKPYLIVPLTDYRFHYYSFSLIGGYGFNWVLGKHWLLNITATPGVGFTKAYEDSLENEGRLMAFNIYGRSSLTYNHKDFFLCLTAKIDGNWYRSDRYSLFNSVETFTANVGFRF